MSGSVIGMLYRRVPPKIYCLWGYPEETSQWGASHFGLLSSRDTNTSMYIVLWLLRFKKNFVQGCTYTAIAWMRRNSDLAVEGEKI